MGILEIRSAFNSVAAPSFQARRAYHKYTRTPEGEMQILEFGGQAQGGAKFNIASDPLPGNANLEAAARKMAADLLKRGKTE